MRTRGLVLLVILVSACGAELIPPADERRPIAPGAAQEPSATPVPEAATGPAPALVPPGVPRRGLVAFWGGEGSARDTGGGCDGKVTDGVTFAVGKVGRCFQFDGESGRIAVPTAEPLDVKAITISAWVRLNSATGDEQIIVSKLYDAGGGCVPAYVLELNHDRLRPQLVVQTESQFVYCAAAGGLPLKKWCHVVGTYDGSTMRIYVDGEEKNSVAVSGAIRKSGSPLMVGANDWASDRNPLNGCLDEVGLWNRALTDVEVRKLAGSDPWAAGGWPGGLHLPRRDLVAHWSCDGDAEDSCAKSHGKLRDDAAFAEGRLGKALKLDGRDDFVTMGDVLDWGRGSWTLAVWFKKTSTGKGLMTLVNKGHTAYGQPQEAGYKIRIGQKRICFAVADESGSRWEPVADEPSVNRWHQAVAVLDRAAEEIRLYIDGQLVARSGVKNMGSLDTNVPLAFGGLDRGDLGPHGGEYFKGLIDDAAMWSRAMSTEEVGQLFRAADLGVCFGAWAVPEVARQADADRVLLAGGSLLLGTIQNERFVVKAAYGEIELPAGRVVAVTRVPSDRSLVQVVLADGQVVVGSLSGTVTLKTTSGATLAVDVAHVDALSYRTIAEKPEDTTARGPMVLLDSGDRLAWSGEDVKLELELLGQRIMLPTGGVLRVDAAGPVGDTHVVWLTNGSMLVGTLFPEKLPLRPSLWPDLAITRAMIRGLSWSVEPEMPVGLSEVELAGGSRLCGRLLGEMLTLETPQGTRRYTVASIRSIRQAPGAAGSLAVELWDNSVVTGRAADGELRFEFMPGVALKLAAVDLVSLVRSEVRLPPEAEAEVERLVERLGSEKWREREDAEKELMGKGPLVLPILRKYADSPDAEVRRRVKRIIEKLDPSARPATPPEPVRAPGGFDIGRIDKGGLRQLEEPERPNAHDAASVNTARPESPPACRCRAF